MDKGSLAYINYTLRVKGEEGVVETTVENIAKEAGLQKEGAKYKPTLVAAGDRWVVEGLDDALLEMSEGEKRVVEVPPEKAFGQRDLSKIKLVPLRKFGEEASRIRVGDRVDMDGQVGTISYIGSGRVAVDLNPKLAGKTLLYDVEVVKVLAEAADRVRALVSYTLKLDETDVKVSVQDSSAVISLPTEKQSEESYYMRRIAASYIFRYVKDVNRVVFQEVYEREAEPQPTASAEQAAVESEAKEAIAPPSDVSAEGGSQPEGASPGPGSPS